ncbi:hypothetical protein Daus18300_009652 [Diaporthe australafricana]|uniref:Protein kinase domain-containing protein n=1 Tax=Diaporthe australafricana TaxID=127596 RepID=A0ABR3WDG7_9PEZI
MEYCEHGDLNKYIKSRGKLTEKETKDITWQVLGGLSLMHEAKFAHRDIKPANILIKSRPPAEWWVKLCDLGLSKRAEDSASATVMRGTPGFMAPEKLGLNSEGTNGVDEVDPFPADMSLMSPRPKDRLLADQALYHPWIAIEDEPEQCPIIDVEESLIIPRIDDEQSQHTQASAAWTQETVKCMDNLWDRSDGDIQESKDDDESVTIRMEMDGTIADTKVSTQRNIERLLGDSGRHPNVMDKIERPYLSHRSADPDKDVDSQFGKGSRTRFDASELHENTPMNTTYMEDADEDGNPIEGTILYPAKRHQQNQEIDASVTDDTRPGSVDTRDARPTGRGEGNYLHSFCYSDNDSNASTSSNHRQTMRERHEENKKWRLMPDNATQYCPSVSTISIIDSEDEGTQPYAFKRIQRDFPRDWQDHPLGSDFDSIGWHPHRLRFYFKPSRDKHPRRQSGSSHVPGTRLGLLDIEITDPLQLKTTPTERKNAED